MSKTTYQISLKGYVGGYEFLLRKRQADNDRTTVDRELAKNEGKQVNVLIDSLGGSLATGLSISAAFNNHGNVNVHFVGLNASAATSHRSFPLASLNCSVYHSTRTLPSATRYREALGLPRTIVSGLSLPLVKHRPPSATLSYSTILLHRVLR